MKQYVFVSTKSVYESLPEPSLTEETGEISVLEDPGVEEVTGETYGALKALCEEAAEAAMPGRVLNLRPGLYRGPARSQRSLHLLAGAHRARGRGARSGHR